MFIFFIVLIIFLWLYILCFNYVILFVDFLLGLGYLDKVNNWVLCLMIWFKYLLI